MCVCVDFCHSSLMCAPQREGENEKSLSSSPQGRGSGDHAAVNLFSWHFGHVYTSTGVFFKPMGLGPKLQSWPRGVQFLVQFLATFPNFKYLFCLIIYQCIFAPQCQYILISKRYGHLWLSLISVSSSLSHLLNSVSCTFTLSKLIIFTFCCVLFV